MNKKNTYLWVTGIIVVLLIVGLSVYLVKKPSVSPQNQPSQETQTPAQNTQNKTEAPAQTPNQGTTGTSATPPVGSTSPSSNQNFSSCVMLDEKYCKDREPLYWPEEVSSNIPTQLQESWVKNKGKLDGFGFNLPVGSKIYAPFDGLVTFGSYLNKENKEIDLIQVRILPLKTNSINFGFAGSKIDAGIDKEFMDQGKRFVKTTIGPGISGIEVKKGEMIGTINNKIGLVSLAGIATKYNLMIHASTEDWSMWESGIIPATAIPAMVSQYFDITK